MAGSRLPMRKLRDVLRLKYEAGLPQRAIAQACGLGLGTVTTYLQRATAAGLTWPLPDDLDDGALEARLFTRPALRPGAGGMRRSSSTCPARIARTRSGHPRD
jgi:DNA-binding transcriptional regulator LsrR (DeoR family)